MRKIGHYLYNITFFISRFITLFLCGLCFYALLNAKYAFSERFFTFFIYISLPISEFVHELLNIKTIYPITSSLFVDPNPVIMGFKYNVYKLICINSQNINILILAAVFILFIYFIIKKYALNSKKRIILINIIIFFVYLIIYLYTKNLNFFTLSIISPTFFSIFCLLDTFLPFQKTVILFPVIGEICSINNIIKYIFKCKIGTEIFILIISLILSTMIYVFLPFYNKKIYSKVLMKNRDFYSISINNSDNSDRFVVTADKIFVFDAINNKKYKVNTQNKIKNNQNAVCNWNKSEMYIFDFKKKSLLLLDMKTGVEKGKIQIFNDEIREEIDCRLVCDNNYRNLLISFEFKYDSFLIDLDNFKVLSKYPVLGLNDSVIYNKFRNSFLLTFFQREDFIQEINISNNSIEKIKVDTEQGYIAISEQNKEVYIAFHQQGRIGIYDAETMKFKRKIKTNYAVKDITYDEDLNVLIAPSYFTGYVDIFLMDGSDKLLTRKFVGYELREARFDANKKNLYICSRNALYKVPVDIKDLINKYKNVSYETKNGNL